MSYNFIKIGENLHDKNCSISEAKMVKKVVDECGDKTILYVLNGMLGAKEEAEILRRAEGFRAMVFILTDLSLEQSCKRVIEQSNFVLHSSSKENFSEERYGKKGMYSFIPDMYFEENAKPKWQSEVILCGGSFGGEFTKCEDFRKYIEREAGKVNDGLLVLYKDGSTDSRVPYEEYKKIISSCKYTLCIKRDEFKKAGWITPRFLDAISNYSFPFVDREYDALGHYKVLEISKVVRYSDMSAIKKVISEEESFRVEVIERYREDARRNKDMFRKCLKIASRKGR